MPVQDVHERSLTKAAALSRYWREDMFTPNDVIPVLNKAGISFVLIGAYGLGGWMREARATEDVDVVVAVKHLKKAVRALTAAFTTLEIQDEEVVVHLRDPDTRAAVIDIVKPTQPHLRVIFKHSQTVTSGGQEYRIPSLEMAIILKFAPMISLTRRDKDKYQDAHDFLSMVENNPALNLKKLTELGDLVYSGGGAEVVELVRKARAGEKLEL